MKIKKDKILVGSSGTGTAFGIISRLKSTYKNQIDIYTMDILPEHLCTASIFSEKHFQVPKLSDSNFENKFKKILIDNDISTFIPILNEEMVIAYELSKRKDFKHIDFWSSEIYSKLVNKEEAYNLLIESEIKVPESIFLYSDFEKNKKDASSLFFAKPKIGIGSKDAQIVNIETTKVNKTFFDDYLLQEICEKPEITVDSFYDNKKKKLYIYCRERIEVKSGVSVKTRIFLDAELYDISKKIAVSIDQTGAICFQVMKNKEGHYVVTDLNLRTGAGTNMTCSAGFDILSSNYALRKSLPYDHLLSEMTEGQEIFLTRQYVDFVM